MGATRPKNDLSAFDVLVLADELGAACGSYIDKVLQPSERELSLRLKLPGGDRRELVVEDGKWAYLRGRRSGEGSEPSAFAMLLRKHLENSRVLSVGQHGFERILVITTGNGYELILELFGEGNVVLVKEGSIVQPLRDRSWEHREVRPGQTYRFPPARTDPREQDESALAKILSGSKGDLVRTLAVSLNLGGRYAEEACAETGLDRNLKVGKLTAANMRDLHSAVMGLFSRLATGRIPTMYLEGGVPVDFAPLGLRSPAGWEARPYPDLNSLVEAYVDYWRGKKAFDARASRLSDEVDRVRRQMESQKKAIEAFRGQAAACRRAGEAVSASVGILSDVLGRAGGLRRSGGWKAVEEAVRRGELAPATSVQPHEGTIVVRIPDLAGMELELSLDVRKGARENAARFFSDSKEAAGKAERTGAQLEESLRTIEKLEREGLPGERAPDGPVERRRPQWFEKYRWFISGDKNVVVGGRDASTNDRIVKRHLGDQDIYAHADFHGAPSVVVKRSSDQAEIPERTLREACLFALATSKAWAAGIASGSAYWVRPDQVSKTPESGEFLPRGGFMIRGRKNTFNDLEMRLAIGHIEVGGGRVLMCGPESAVRAGSAKYVLLQPGEDEHKAVARRAAVELGCDPEEVIRLLPPGKCQLLLPP